MGTFKYCKFCGKQIEHDSTFCVYCGKKQISQDKEFTTEKNEPEIDKSIISPPNNIYEDSDQKNRDNELTYERFNIKKYTPFYISFAIFSSVFAVTFLFEIFVFSVFKGRFESVGDYLGLIFTLSIIASFIAVIIGTPQFLTTIKRIKINGETEFINNVNAISSAPRISKLFKPPSKVNNVIYLNMSNILLGPLPFSKVSIIILNNTEAIISGPRKYVRMIIDELNS